ncbi:hypothetical protein WA538_004412 [Blastocystis sp. DL]
MSLTFHTNFGDLKIELFCELIPKNCENFLALCASGYYDNTKFHRNVKGVFIQGGDPTGKGKGGESISGEPVEDEFNPNVKFDRRGIVAMAKQHPNTNKSQFYIIYDKQPQLDMVDTAIGKVIYGMDTLKAMENVPVNEKYRPTQDILIRSVTIHANPFAP